jgi:hypothetical protein
VGGVQCVFQKALAGSPQHNESYSREVMRSTMHVPRGEGMKTFK